MSLALPDLGIVHKTVGRTPWSARVPLDPLFAPPNQPHAISKEADRGAADRGAAAVRPQQAAP